MHSRLFHRFALPALALLSACVLPARAAVQNRINTPLTEGDRASVQHTVSGRARTATDVGLAPADRTLQSLTFRFSMTSAQQAALTQLLMDQQNPNSPSYHQWLTPEQFGARFGLASADLAKVQAWLTSQGFTITSTARSSTSISFTGTVGQVQRAFGTDIHTVSADGEQHITNLSDPTLPAALAGVVLDITGLNDFKLKSRARVKTVAESVVRPQYTSSVSSVHYMAPGDLYTIYDMNALLSNSINGTGISIAVVGQTDISLTDVAAFRSASGLPANNPTVKLYGTDPGTVSGDLEEAQLDVEWSGAAAPSASIVYVNSRDVLNTSLVQAIENNLAPIVSISYGLCENAASVANLDGFNQLFQQANSQGQTIVGPGGDSGATDCDYQFATATQGLAVDFPASSQFVTGAGGTMFNEGSATGATQYWSGSNVNSLPAILPNLTSSALSYIPETVWNESNSSGLGAGGGGASAYFSKPSWQKGNGVPADFARDVPDISLNSASLHDGYLFCSGGSCTNGFRNAQGNLNVVGGTSVAAPTFAGILALVEQQIGSRVGNANYGLYALANSQYYNNVFHDVTAGNNNSACSIGTPNCPNGGSIGYSATQGYDLATGWGSVSAYNLATKWTLAAPPGASFAVGLLSATTLTTSSAACGVVSSSNLVLNVSAKNDTVLSAGSGTPAVPTGTVQFLVDNVVVGSPVALVNGALQNYTLNTSSLSSGGHIITAAYSGDSFYAGSRGVLSTDIVSATKPDFSLTPCVPNTTVRTGGTAPGVTFTFTPFNGFTGSIALSAVADTQLSASYVFSVTPVVISSTSGVTTVFTLTASQSNATTTTGMIKLASGGSSSLHRMPWYAAGSGATLACVLLFTVPRRRRWGALLAVVLSVSALTAIGCGSSSSSSSSSSGGTTTPTTTAATPGTYNITVTGVATTANGNVVHSANVTFVVTQ